MEGFDSVVPKMRICFSSPKKGVGYVYTVKSHAQSTQASLNIPSMGYNEHREVQSRLVSQVCTQDLCQVCTTFAEVCAVLPSLLLLLALDGFKLSRLG